VERLEKKIKILFFASKCCVVFGGNPVCVCFSEIRLVNYFLCLFG